MLAFGGNLRHVRASENLEMLPLPVKLDHISTAVSLRHIYAEPDPSKPFKSSFA
jgi:hypothetical protein